MTPPSAWTGSTRKAAGGDMPLDVSLYWARNCSRCSRPPPSSSAPSTEPKGAWSTCSRGTPEALRNTWLAVQASDPRVMPWKPWVKATTWRRPVTRRASFRAASTALVPVGPENIILWGMLRGSRITSVKRSIKRRLTVVCRSRLWVSPSRSMCSITARFIRSLLWP